MKLSVKTLQGKTYPLDAEPTDLVGKVKSTIESQHGFAAEQQKLIHAGKVLKDDSPLSEYGVKENDFLVVMITKAKPKPAEAPAPPAPVATPSPAPAPTALPAQPSIPATPVLAPPTRATSSTTPSATPAAATRNSDLVTGEALSTTVQQLCDMGFPEDQVQAALRAAFNNPDRAVEYLMSGIPETIPPVAANPGSLAPSTSAASTHGNAASLEALRRHPQFPAIRQLVQANPSSLPAVLQQIGSQSPDLLRLIHDNQEDFVRMLNEPLSAEETQAAHGNSSATMSASPGGLSPEALLRTVASMPPEQQAQIAASMGVTPEQLQQISQMVASMPPEAMQAMMQSAMAGSGAGLGGAGFPGMGGGAGMPGTTTIQLTQEEAAAVNRLCDMGFDRNEVIQAYLACEKNEALAANFLMDNMTGMDFDNSSSGGNSGGDSNDDIYG